MNEFLKKPFIISYGELLWDLLPGGARLGGAPANCAVNISNLGAESHLLSAVGDDELGKKALSALRAREMSVEGIQILNGADTGVVEVSVDAEGIASYSIRRDVAWAKIALRTDAVELASRADGFCYGSLVQAGVESRGTLMALLKGTRADCVRFFDVNLRSPFVFEDVIRESLAYASILKLNEDEVCQVGNLLGIGGGINEVLPALMDEFPMKMILVTCGEKGAMVVTREERVHVDAAPISKLVDTVGAGDAFSAAFLVELLKGADLVSAARAGVAHASRICEVAGAWLPVMETSRA